MKVKFNKYERVAGFCLLFTILGSALTLVSAAVKQGWFESKFHLAANFENADGVHPGTMVQIAGLRAGFVENVELVGSNQIRVNFYVLGKFEERVRKDSKVQLIRPFIIGERVLDLSVGSDESAKVADHEVIPSEEGMDLMTLMSGKKLNMTLSKLSGMLENLGVLAEAFLNKDRTESMVRTFDRIDPLMKNMNNMSVEVIRLGQQLNHEQNIGKLVGNLAVTTEEINRILPELNRQNPALAKDLSVMIQNLAVVSRALGPAMAEVEPQLPMASRRLVETLNETVVTLKAMQKSIFMRGNVREVHEEEAQRLPAGAK